jgi:hypothetical protein
MKPGDFGLTLKDPARPERGWTALGQASERVRARPSSGLDPGCAKATRTDRGAGIDARCLDLPIDVVRVGRLRDRHGRGVRPRPARGRPRRRRPHRDAQAGEHPLLGVPHRKAPPRCAESPPTRRALAHSLGSRSETRPLGRARGFLTRGRPSATAHAAVEPARFSDVL